MVHRYTICQTALPAAPRWGNPGKVSARDPHAFWDRMSEVIRCVRLVAAEEYAELEIGSAQAKMLRHIGENSSISQADLARATDTAPTLTGRALEPLVERGWVRRKRSEEDRRQYLLELTPEGQRARQRVVQKRERVIRRLAAALDARDVDDFDRIAAKILDAFASQSRRG